MRSQSDSAISEYCKAMQTPSTGVTHTSVLLDESIQALALTDSDIVIDGTFGGGGHTSAMLASGKDIHVVCVDLDEEAQKRWQERFRGDRRTQFVKENFKNAVQILSTAHFAQATKVLLDLGTSTFQLLADTRGFSFNSDTPLVMTYAQSGSHTGFDAQTIVNAWSESSIADIIYHYGEDRKARVIARAIVARRAIAPITTSAALANLIEETLGRHGRIHPATKTFQALRIAVNDELGTIKEALAAWLEHIPVGGRIAIITFHSIEDRVVKHWIKNEIKNSHIRVITKKPISPSRKELLENQRARSAKLRAIEKIS